MTNGDPEDPLPILRAAKEVARRWERQAAKEVSDSQEKAVQSPPLAWDMSEAQLKRHFGSFSEAAMGIFNHAVLSLKIRVWIADGPEWKRPTIHTIMGLLPPDSGLYVDQGEVQRVFGRQWPKAFPTVKREPAWPIREDPADWPESAPNESQAGTIVDHRAGRPKGLGYSRKDVSIFEVILDAQRLSGDVETQYSLVKRYADEADGTSYPSKVDRLRKGLPKWLEHNGHQWVRSN
jgi:hypothetical protein